MSSGSHTDASARPGVPGIVLALSNGNRDPRLSRFLAPHAGPATWRWGRLRGMRRARLRDLAAPRRHARPIHGVAGAASAIAPGPGAYQSAGNSNPGISAKRRGALIHQMEQRALDAPAHPLPSGSGNAVEAAPKSVRSNMNAIEDRHYDTRLPNEDFDGGSRRQCSRSSSRERDAIRET